jgi:hypothetical protein
LPESLACAEFNTAKKGHESQNMRTNKQKNKNYDVLNNNDARMALFFLVALVVVVVVAVVLLVAVE